MDDVVPHVITVIFIWDEMTVLNENQCSSSFIFPIQAPLTSVYTTLYNC